MDARARKRQKRKRAKKLDQWRAERYGADVIRACNGVIEAFTEYRRSVFALWERNFFDPFWLPRMPPRPKPESGGRIIYQKRAQDSDATEKTIVVSSRVNTTSPTVTFTQFIPVTVDDDKRR